MVLRLGYEHACRGINFVTVLIHELGHGMGFTVQPTNGATGVRARGIPSVWEEYLMMRHAQNLARDDRPERAASAIDTNNLVWTGLIRRLVLTRCSISATKWWSWRPDSQRRYEVQTATFGPLPNFRRHGSGRASEDSGGVSLTDGCEPLTQNPASRDRQNRVD